MTQQLRERLPEMPLVVLRERPDPNGRVLDLQDYVIEGETVIPLFSNRETLRASARGVDLGRPVFGIDRGLLVGLSKGHEVYLLDPHTEGQLRFTAADLRAAFLSGLASSTPSTAAPAGGRQQPGAGGRAATGTMVVLTIVMWLAWLAVMLVADFLGFLMFAFADAPGSGRAAQAMIGPALAWFAFTFVAGAILLVLRRPWQVVLAFALAVSPPFMIFAGYNVLGGAAATARPAGGATTAAAPGPIIPVPPGGFAPPPAPPRAPIDVSDLFPADPRTGPAATRPAEP